MAASFLVENNEFEIQKGVYYPEKDSYLLMDSVKKETPKRALDLGCGSGIIGLYLTCKGSDVVFSDKQKVCVENAKNNYSKLNSKTNAKFIVSDLFENIEGKFDLISFNPPYVVSDDIKQVSLDGGVKGRELIDRFLDAAISYLNDKGVIYLLQSSQNDVELTIKKFNEQNLKVEKVNEEKLFFEKLIVLKAFK